MSLTSFPLSGHCSTRARLLDRPSQSLPDQRSHRPRQGELTMPTYQYHADTITSNRVLFEPTQSLLCSVSMNCSRKTLIAPNAAIAFRWSQTSRLLVGRTGNTDALPSVLFTMMRNRSGPDRTLNWRTSLLRLRETPEESGSFVA
jgi:hypothetical protein